MRFFITEDERKMSGSTAFIEFQKGVDDGTCWKTDSVCMDVELFSELHLRRFLTLNLPQFDYYGITQVSKREFDKLCENALGFSAEVEACLKELAEWAGEGAEDDVYFTIIGM